MSPSDVVLSRGAIAGTLLAVLAFAAGPARLSIEEAPREKRISFHNRLLLNRIVLAGLKQAEVLLLASDTALDGKPASSTVTQRVAELGGRVLHADEGLGYLRAEIAPTRLADLVDSATVAAWQISSFSLGTWYRDGPPAANAELQRGFETTPVVGASPANPHPQLPELTYQEATAPGFTADDDVGVGAWRRAHPTFDGRGVTIALVENGQPSFSDPVLRTARTLDGREVPKIAGVLNAIDPAAEDETRVSLDTTVVADKTWVRLGNRTYVLPRPGTYRVGMFDVPAGGHLYHRFAIAEDVATSELRIDTNGDASWADETALPDVNHRFEPHDLTLSSPRHASVSFVVARGATPHVVHVYLAKSGHQTMTASVAAGNITSDSLASGVAPGARLLFVRVSSPNVGGVGRILEGFILAARHPQVDVVSASTLVAMIPDTAADFVGMFLTRLQRTSGKPIVISAGNTGLTLGQVQSMGEALSIGGLQGAASFSALHGRGVLPQTLVHIMSAAGPALDGAIKPDVLAPVERISAELSWNAPLQATPQHTPTRRLPPGYGISCCTSASSPYAAGVAALLISAARQSGVTASGERLAHALRMTARPLAGFMAHQQGHGALDVEAAWRAIVAGHDLPRITSTAPIVHPLAQYSAHGNLGLGILEFEGWQPGQSAARDVRLRRTNGPTGPRTYRLEWTADDGSFSSAGRVDLPLDVEVAVPVRITTHTAGAHSGLLTLRDPVNGDPAHRIQATVVAPHRFDTAGFARVSATAPLMQANAHYFEVTRDTGAIEVELQVTRGVVSPTLLPAHGLFPSYYLNVHPIDVFTVGPGTYRILMPDPEPGTWTVRVKNASIFYPPGFRFGPVDTVEASYTVAVRRFAASLRAARAPGGRIDILAINRGSHLSQPVVTASPGSLRSHRQSYRADATSNMIEIDVPPGADALSLHLQADTTSDLYLYDCTSGECFSYDIAFPPSLTQRLLVRNPAPGRWVAAVCPGGRFRGIGSFVLDEVITTSPSQQRVISAMDAGGTSRSVFDSPPLDPASAGRVPVLFFELFDRAADAGEKQFPWSTTPNFVQQRDRPVAIATLIYRP